MFTNPLNLQPGTDTWNVKMISKLRFFCDFSSVIQTPLVTL